MASKYLVFKDCLGKDRAVIFGEDVNHSDITLPGKIVSGGFFSLSLDPSGSPLEVFGKTGSLYPENVGFRPEDQELLAQVMAGFNDLELQNLATLREIEGIPDEVFEQSLEGSPTV